MRGAPPPAGRLHSMLSALPEWSPAPRPPVTILEVAAGIQNDYEELSAPASGYNLFRRYRQLCSRPVASAPAQGSPGRAGRVSRPAVSQVPQRLAARATGGQGL